MAENREFLSIPEAAALMGVSRIAVFKKVKKGQLAAIRIGRNWAIAAAALQSPAFPPVPRSAAAPAPRPAIKPKSAAVPRPVSVFKPVPEKDPLDEMGWD
jgi:excisionase family DNA binding protein